MSRACQALGIALELVVSDSPADLLRIALTCKLIAQVRLPRLVNAQYMATLIAELRAHTFILACRCLARPSDA